MYACTATQGRLTLAEMTSPFAGSGQLRNAVLLE
jgi:hypothetical protein